MPWQNNEYHHTKRRKCTRCAKHYTETSNTGNWQCFYHPTAAGLNSNAYHPLGTMRCCGGAIGSRGCTPIDHDDGMFRFEDALLYDAETDSSAKCSSAARKRILNFEGRPGLGLQTDKQTFVKLWRVNTWVRQQYQKYGKVTELSVSVQLDTARPCSMVICALASDANKDRKAAYAREKYEQQLVATRAPNAAQARCRREFGERWSHKNRKERLAKAKRFLDEALVKTRQVCEEAEEDAVKEVEEIKKTRKRAICAELMKSVWDTENEKWDMFTKIQLIGALEREETDFRWSYGPLGWTDLTFEALHAQLTARGTELWRNRSALKLKILNLHLTEVSLTLSGTEPKKCRVDFRNNYENFKAVLAYVFCADRKSATVTQEDWQRAREDKRSVVSVAYTLQDHEA